MQLSYCVVIICLQRNLKDFGFTWFFLPYIYRIQKQLIFTSSGFYCSLHVQAVKINKKKKKEEEFISNENKKNINNINSKNNFKKEQN